MILPSVVLVGYVALPWYYLREHVPIKHGGGERVNGKGGSVVAGEGGAGGGDGDRDAASRGAVMAKDDEQVKKEDVKMEHLFRTFRFCSICWSGVLANVQFGYLEATYADQAAHPGRVHPLTLVL